MSPLDDSPSETTEDLKVAMPIYSFRCTQCGHRQDSTSPERFPCPQCSALIGRDYSDVQFRSPNGSFQPHFNWAVGTYVRNEAEYRDELKRCAERNSIATGTDHVYEPRMMSEVKPFDTPEAQQALENRAKVLTDRSTKHLVTASTMDQPDE